MASSDDPGSGMVAAGVSHEIVNRSEVAPDRPYGEYRPQLRYDFFYSCAYCTMTEAEAQAIRFTIDHYEPRSIRPDLADQYANLMYACDKCNVLKGNRCPSEDARHAGYRFFRPDMDVRSENFERIGVRLHPKSHTGSYTIECLDLNRLSLRKLRELRARLSECDIRAEDGIMALRRFKIDQLHPSIRGKVYKAIKDAEATRLRLEQEVDALLRERAKSPLLEEETDPAERKRRSRAIQKTEALFPSSWHRRAKSR